MAAVPIEPYSYGGPCHPVGRCRWWGLNTGLAALVVGLATYSPGKAVALPRNLPRGLAYLPWACPNCVSFALILYGAAARALSWVRLSNGHRQTHWGLRAPSPWWLAGSPMQAPPYWACTSWLTHPAGLSMMPPITQLMPVNPVPALGAYVGPASPAGFTECPEFSPCGSENLAGPKQSSRKGSQPSAPWDTG